MWFSRKNIQLQYYVIQLFGGGIYCFVLWVYDRCAEQFQGKMVWNVNGIDSGPGEQIKWQRSFHGVQLRNRWSYWLCLLQLICCILLEVTIYIYTHTHYIAFLERKELLITQKIWARDRTATATWIGGYCDPIKIWVSCWTWFSHFYVPG